MASTPSRRERKRLDARLGIWGNLDTRGRPVESVPIPCLFGRLQPTTKRKSPRHARGTTRLRSRPQLAIARCLANASRISSAKRIPSTDSIAVEYIDGQCFAIDQLAIDHKRSSTGVKRGTSIRSVPFAVLRSSVAAVSRHPVAHGTNDIDSSP